MTHIEDCIGGDDCEPKQGNWSYAGADWMEEAKNQLEEDAAYCRVHQLAWKLREADEAGPTGEWAPEARA